ncbi:MAG: DcrB-related protein [Thermodesulfobacteriota bacterium]|jgi:hypothetical protein
MSKILTGFFVLVGLIMILAFMPVPNATAATFVNKAPDFTMTVPSWGEVNSRNKNSVLRKAQDSFEVTSFDVAVADLPEGKTYKDLAKEVMDFLATQYMAKNFSTLYEREIKLKDGTPAYELELKWDHPMLVLYTYQLAVFKDKKMITVQVASDKQISDKLKEIPMSLVFK